MDFGTWISLGAGLLIGLFVSTVFYAYQWNAEHDTMLEWKAIAEEYEETIKHLENIVHPQQWLNASDVAVNIATKERLYDKYPDLVQPGSEVLIIDEEGDIPEMPDNGEST